MTRPTSGSGNPAMRYDDVAVYLSVEKAAKVVVGWIHLRIADGFGNLRRQTTAPTTATSMDILGKHSQARPRYQLNCGA